jgi:hypothetical protein
MLSESARLVRETVEMLGRLARIRDCVTRDQAFALAEAARDAADALDRGGARSFTRPQRRFRTRTQCLNRWNPIEDATIILLPQKTEARKAAFHLRTASA